MKILTVYQKCSNLFVLNASLHYITYKRELDRGRLTVLPKVIHSIGGHDNKGSLSSGSKVSSLFDRLAYCFVQLSSKHDAIVTGYF